MDSKQALALTQLMDGSWKPKLTDAEVSAWQRWFQGTEATFEQCQATIRDLMDDHEFRPTAKKVNDALKAAGVVGPPRMGEQDPRVMKSLRESLLRAAGNTSRIRKVSMRDALQLWRDNARVVLEEVSAMGEDAAEEKGYWTDRLVALDDLLKGSAA